MVLELLKFKENFAKILPLKYSALAFQYVAISACVTNTRKTYLWLLPSQTVSDLELPSGSRRQFKFYKHSQKHQPTTISCYFFVQASFFLILNHIVRIKFKLQQQLLSLLFILLMFPKLTCCTCNTDRQELLSSDVSRF